MRVLFEGLLDKLENQSLLEQTLPSTDPSVTHHVISHIPNPHGFCDIPLLQSNLVLHAIPTQTKLQLIGLYTSQDSLKLYIGY